MDYKKEYEGLSQEFDNINDRWAEDNERNNEIIGDQQEQIKQLKEENEKLKDCSYDEYCALIATENNLVKEFQDMKNECGSIAEENKKLKEENEKLIGAGALLKILE